LPQVARDFPKVAQNFSKFKVAQNLLQKKSKVAFCNLSWSKVAKKKQKLFFFCFSLLLLVRCKNMQSVQQ